MLTHRSIGCVMNFDQLGMKIDGFKVNSNRLVTRFKVGKGLRARNRRRFIR